jgi:hypothetical protein
MAIEYQTFLAFKNSVQPIVAPEDLGEELEDYFRDQVGNALCDLQTLIPWLRDFNVMFVTKTMVNEFCNASVFEGPTGKIAQVFAYKPGIDCKKFHYKRVSTAAIDCWTERQRCMCPATTPPSSNVYDSPYCNYVLNGDTACLEPYLTSEEDECKFKSLMEDDRIFAVSPNYQIHAAPRFPCGYVLVVQWQGIKRKWLDTDLVPVDQMVREAVVNYVESKIAKKEREWETKDQYERDYAVNLRMLGFRYHDEQDTIKEKDCTSAIEQLMPAILPAYESPVYGPDGVSVYPGGGTGGGSSGGFGGVYEGRAPAPPDDPTQPAIDFPVGGGPIQQWSVALQSWV